MSALRKKMAIFLTAAGLLLGIASEAFAEHMVFNFRNASGSRLEVQLYADARSHVWPAVDQNWILEPNGRRYSQSILCEAQEKICFGAWVQGREDINYGTARNNTTRCQQCCYICNGRGTNDITLNPPDLSVKPQPSSLSSFSPSYDCNDATLNEAEQTICRTENLSQLDRDLTDLYNSLLETFPKAPDVARARNDQKQFLVQRNACGSSTACIENNYTARMQQIRNMGVSVLPGD